MANPVPIHRAFVATGTLLRLDGQDDNKVEVQGVIDYKYTEGVEVGKKLLVGLNIPLEDACH